jgi:hypothetical protein
MSSMHRPPGVVALLDFGKGEHFPNWQLPPGHWLSKAQVVSLGDFGNGEQRPNSQLPPIHSLSNAQDLAAGGCVSVIAAHPARPTITHAAWTMPANTA